jgi:hypothetical protein
MNIPFFNYINDNIIIYNGENLPENIRANVTKSILSLFNKCSSIYDQKIFRSGDCIWFIVSRNISEYYILNSLQNVLAKAVNKHILIDAFRNYPYILQNLPIHNTSYYDNFNFLFNISNTLINTPNNVYDTFDLLE